MHKLEDYLPFWEKLNKEKQTLLKDNFKTVNYKKGSHVYSASEECLGVLVILKGSLRTYILSDEGREVTLYNLYENDVCVLSASCVLSQITFDVFVDAREDCSLLLISPAAFSSVMKTNVYAENFMLRITAERFSDTMWAMQQILFMGFDKRLAIYLLDEMNRKNTNVIKTTHGDIAKEIGSAREVVSRMLKSFAEDGVVSINRGTVEIINKKYLQNLVRNQ
ncbi:MAG: Crp/Fnr family transcriptional regulator [Anaeromassilibacillus sp.]|nr:Crp/Fnr family transcriptional regulator [Anaeromassilibacillus sp.]MDY3780048.1 Crp/Fnr family transcriptional regulator [Candidatus Limousia pullorum]